MYSPHHITSGSLDHLSTSCTGVSTLQPFVLIQVRLDKKVVIQRLLGTEPLLRIQLQQALQELNGLSLRPTQRTLFLLPATRPDDDPFERKPLLANRLEVRLEHGPVHRGADLHPLLAEDTGDFNHGVDVVGGVEEREAAGEESQKDHAGRPDVDLGRLRGAFEEDFWGAEAAGSGSVGAAGRSAVVLWVAG